MNIYTVYCIVLYFVQSFLPFALIKLTTWGQPNISSIKFETTVFPQPSPLQPLECQIWLNKFLLKNVRVAYLKLNTLKKNKEKNKRKCNTMVPHCTPTAWLTLLGRNTGTLFTLFWKMIDVIHMNTEEDCLTFHFVHDVQSRTTIWTVQTQSEKCQG